MYKTCNYISLEDCIGDLLKILLVETSQVSELCLFCQGAHSYFHLL